MSYVRDAVALPSPGHLKTLKQKIDVPARVIVLNVLAQALLTVGVFASLYAGYA
ncbi:lipid II flippase family protein [Caulobacter segnis]